ncbi:transcriptional regulator [bacterium (Candidatus Blackallbacteria) CG18_big_fil_WC_8_21_14_2_50_49_26]|nr:MAG: transcriptional regulator [bacterium (Candidatus Blackallbacteria) CG18_big_fil_WC_8_21_14_2_50_49_26]
MGIQERIKKWRTSLGMSQAAFCNETGIPLRTLKGYEAGTRHPGSEALAAMANTGLNINWLLTGEGDMSKSEPIDTQVELSSEEIAEFQANMKEIFDLLLMIDEDKRGAAIQEMLARVQEAARINELERLVKKLQNE